LLRRPSPPPDSARWEKHHDRLERRRLKRAAATPEKLGLVGCWQVIGVLRETIPLATPHAAPTAEIGFYTCSLGTQETSAAKLSEAIRDHWSSSENGTHYRRDVTFREDECRVRHRGAAQVLASLRNLANGIYELGRDAGRTTADTLPSWCRQQTFSTALQALRR